MSLRIGLDFDNTIACYDLAFLECARFFYPDFKAANVSKSGIKSWALSQPDGDQVWQKIQGKVYGKFIDSAVVFPGLVEFLWKCKVLGAEIFIVSHKTEFGHFDEERINLREAAQRWLCKQGISAEQTGFVRPENIFFASTREEKVQKILSLQLTHFVDDLIEVFETPGFPEQTQKMLFHPSTSGAINQRFAVPAFSSWRTVASAIFPEVKASSLLQIACSIWPELSLSEMTAIYGRGNSGVYRVWGAGQSYALKIYPDRMLDTRNRLENEFSVCEFLNRQGFPVVKPIAQHKALNWGLYEWIEGKDLTDARPKRVADCVEFIAKLYGLSQDLSRHQFQLASEACLSGADIHAQIQRRLLQLEAAENLELQQFLTQDLQPVLDLAVSYAKSLIDRFDTPLAGAFLVPSPSDFGFHNTKDVDGQTIFIDLEYFGWDDPVKLVSDFLWHPGMNLTQEEADFWQEKTTQIFDVDPGFSRRFLAFHPLYGLRWCLILLNEFVKNKLSQRLAADSRKAADVREIQAVQLSKARLMLHKVKKILQDR